MNERGLLGLTTRQRDYLQLIAEGKSNKEIALALGVSERTVHAMLYIIYRKMGVSKRTQALTAYLGIPLNG